MAFYIFTGKLGGGKTLCAVGRIRDKLKAGCIVATNLDIDLVQMCSRDNKTVRLLRVPDKPCIEDLNAIGKGNETYDEDKNGLLVLDECGTWFNSRNWQDKARKAVNDWFLHARKLGWDVILIIQDISILDSQARECLAEMTAFCRRTDKLSIPYIGTLFKLFFDSKLPLPRVHSARVVYGTNPRDLLSDRYVYRGSDLYACYDTKQMFLDDYPHATYSALTPWHIRGRYLRPKDWRYYMKATRIYWKRFNRPVIAALASITASAVTFAYTNQVQVVPGTTLAQGPKPSETVDQVKLVTLQDQLEGFVYAGRNTINRNTTYYFSHPSKPDMTSESYLLKNAAYKETAYCVIEIHKGRDVAVLQCQESSGQLQM